MKDSVVTAAAAMGMGSLEDRTLLTHLAMGAGPASRPGQNDAPRSNAGRSEAATPPAAPDAIEANRLPHGRIGDVQISRIICGGNLIGGFAHSRDLTYVSPLLKHYFTDEKIIETLEVCEECGVNTIITGSSSAPLLRKYWDERGGRIQWIAQVVPSEADLLGDAKRSIDGGAAGAFVIGNMGDQLTRAGRVDLVGQVVEFIRSQGVIAGCGGHNLETVMACEQAKVPVDFYMKTSHSTSYWSRRTPDQTKDVIDNYGTDNYWDKEPEKTVAFMATVSKPWIAYKVMAAGAIHPRVGFRYAWENGADFVCAGMFDFQVIEDALIAREIFDKGFERQRPWCA